VSVKVKPVANSRDKSEFIRFPYKLLKRWKTWVPPLISDVKDTLDFVHNPFYQHARIQLFNAYYDGKIVGRIAGIVDENYIKTQNRAVGLFGFFECVKDRAVSAALFNTASQWLREEGMVHMVGPTNPSLNDELGVLIDAFDIPPAVKMVWNPPYYPALYEAAGFKKAMDVYAYDLAKEHMSERLIRMGEKIMKRTKVTFRNPDMKRFDEEIKIFRELYNRAWSENWGFVPWTEAEFEHVAKTLKMVIDPKVVYVAELNSKPVGFSMALPDLNFALKHLRGRLFPFGILKLLWYSRKIDRLRVVILGVDKKYRNQGIDTALYYINWKEGTSKKYKSGEASWILESNTAMIRAAEMMGGKRYKTYRIYERSL